jgi:membrane protein
MARLSDLPRVWKRVGFFKFWKRVLDEARRDNLLTWAAALAYSWIFAIFPFFIFLLALLPYLPAGIKTRAKHEIHVAINAALPHEEADLIWSNINDNYLSILNEPRGKLLYFGLGFSLIAASGGMATTMSALDRCYELERSRPFYVQRPLALLLTIIVMALLVVVAFLLPVGNLIKELAIHLGYATRLSLPMLAFDVGRWSLSLLFMMMVLSIIYYKGPAVRHRFRWLSPGAVFSVLVWVILAVAFRAYVDRMGARGYQRTYGAVAGVAILLLFFYIDALVLLIGAEINSEIDFEILQVRRGSNDFLEPKESPTCPPEAI